MNLKTLNYTIMNNKSKWVTFQIILGLNEEL